MIEPARALWLDELTESGTPPPSRASLKRDHQVNCAEAFTEAKG
ncbi:MAG: hypothetical protein OXN44_09135 [Acidimicrobiaceae bacterium]|nr:hypothetical protein [Acidimicrobiaceae bacterium]